MSNGVQTFREPVVRNARFTLSVVIGILVVMLAAIAWLCRAYHIGATPPGQAGYQSVLSQLTAAVAGRGVYYGITIASILSVLCLSANTSFAGFPQLCRTVAADGYCLTRLPIAAAAWCTQKVYGFWRSWRRAC